MIVYIVITVVAIACLIVCCFGISSSSSIRQTTHWLKYDVTNTTLGPTAPVMHVSGNLWGITVECDTCPPQSTASMLGCMNATCSGYPSCSWDDYKSCAVRFAPTSAGQLRADSAGSLKVLVFLALFATVLKAATAAKRMRIESDSGCEKSKVMYTGCVAFFIQVAQIGTFVRKCYKDIDEMPEVSATLGVGSKLMIAAILLTVPTLVINLLIPAPAARQDRPVPELPA